MNKLIKSIHKKLHNLVIFNSFMTNVKNRYCHFLLFNIIFLSWKKPCHQNVSFYWWSEAWQMHRTSTKRVIYMNMMVPSLEDHSN